MNDKPEFLFGVPIWGFILKNERYHSANYLERVLEIVQNEPSIQKSNFGGYQSRDTLHQEPIFQEFIKLLNYIGNDIVKSYSNKKVSCQEMWANVNGPGDFNMPHTHGGILSGVFYLTVPEDSGRLVLINPAVRSQMNPVITAKNYGVIPQPLACLMFPSWLEHYVEPNKSQENRISISFNFHFDDPL